MNNKKFVGDESMWEKVEQKVKFWAHNLMHELL